MSDSPLAWRAAELKKHFAVFGYFYDFQLGEQRLSCRAVLELIRHERVPAHPGAVLQQRPDLLVVMMNPGGSRPLDPDHRPPLCRAVADIARHRQLHPTRPDTTQYQIMRVMAARGWGHARVLNLSDLRQSKSPLLFRQIRALGQLPGGAVHSLFSPSRREELMALGGGDADLPVLAGWGRAPDLLPLARQCRGALAGHPFLGVVVDDGAGLLYAHPSPQLQRLKDAWLAAVMTQLAGG